MKVEKRWFLRNEVGGFIGIDQEEGGHHYYTDFWHCHKFESLFAAEEYASRLDAEESLEIYETDEIGLHYLKNVHDPYEVELAALKKKYGRT